MCARARSLLYVYGGYVNARGNGCMIFDCDEIRQSQNARKLSALNEDQRQER